MGCGASTSRNVSIDADGIDPSSKKNLVHILLAGHSSLRSTSERIRQDLLNEGFSCHLIDESTPRSLSNRAELIQWCDLVVVVINRLYQRTFSCMETLNYAKDIRKPLVSILAEATFRPYGALGAISAIAIQSIVMKEESSVARALIKIARTQVKPTGETSPLPKMEDDPETLNLPSGKEVCTVLIGTTDDGAPVAQLIFEALITSQPSTMIENYSKTNATCSTGRCTVFVPILTPQLAENVMGQAAFEHARRLGKPIVPVMAVKKWKPTGWLGLLVAGRTFYRIFDRETAFRSFYDSNRITDLRVGIEAASQSAPSLAEREEIEKTAIQKEIDLCKSQLTTWPPKRKSRVIQSMNPRKAVRVNVPTPRANAFFEHTHHTITRVDLKAPPPLVDQYGLPKRRPLDCMISYQWDRQELVRQIFEDLHMRKVQTWFDIWGAMQGGTNDAMATGVECAKVLLIFLSKAYVSSVNCQLEFRYAVQRGKAFVVLHTEPSIPLERWMSDAFEGFPRFDVYSYDVLPQLINGVPMIDVIVQNLRVLAQGQPSDPVDNGLSDLAELRSLLDDARDALSLQTGQARYKTCTRCSQKFHQYAKEGCKKHAEYFLGGGGMMEDQWVCCRQQTANSPGCVPCEHTDQTRVFVEDPDYGTSSWRPA